MNEGQDEGDGDGGDDARSVVAAAQKAEEDKNKGGEI